MEGLASLLDVGSLTKHHGGSDFRSGDSPLLQTKKSSQRPVLPFNSTLTQVLCKWLLVWMVVSLSFTTIVLIQHRDAVATHSVGYAKNRSSNNASMGSGRNMSCNEVVINIDDGSHEGSQRPDNVQTDDPNQEDEREKSEKEILDKPWLRFPL